MSITVTPHAGVWIETIVNSTDDTDIAVTPHAGVWIETHIWRRSNRDTRASLPMRECGLKQRMMF